MDPSKQFIGGETLIIFDELQEFPDIATSLKFFKIDGRFDVICGGSMLGINYHKIESNSVGYKSDYEMYSMDFEKFLWAKGYNDGHIESMLENMKNLTPFNEVEMSVYNNHFLDFCILGECLRLFVVIIKGTFEGSLELQRQLIIDYKEDIRKYAVGMDQTRILNVFNHIPIQLAKDNKSFRYLKLLPAHVFAIIAVCIEWLDDAGIINLCYCLEFSRITARGNYDDTKYKIYFANTGCL